MYGWTRKYTGIPFSSGGRDEQGCDCWGLVRLILQREYGIFLPALSDGYSDACLTGETAGLFRANAPLILGERIMKPQEKALAIIRFCGVPSHVGLYAGDGYIIHSRFKAGAVCERTSSPLLSGRIEGWYRVSESYSKPQPVLCGTEGI